MTQQDQTTPKPETTPRKPAPYTETVKPQWIDYNGHMNIAYYLMVFDLASDDLLDLLGLGIEYRNRENCSMFVVETHITYQREALEGEKLSINTRIFSYDSKRLHLFQQMCHEASGEAVATNEVMLLHVDMTVRRAARFAPAIAGRIEAVYAGQTNIDRPEQAGRAIETLQPMNSD